MRKFAVLGFVGLTVLGLALLVTLGGPAKKDSC